MKAKLIEATYRQKHCGRSEEIAYVTGATLKRMFAIGGQQIEKTTDGKTIRDEAMYALTSYAVVEVE